MPCGDTSGAAFGSDTPKVVHGCFRLSEGFDECRVIRMIHRHSAAIGHEPMLILCSFPLGGVLIF